MKNFKTSTLVLLATIMVSNKAFAIFEPTYERPIVNSNMEITDTFGSFDNVFDVSVTLNKRDGENHVTSITVQYSEAMGPMLPAFRNISKTYTITPDNITYSCGSIIYTVSNQDSTDGVLGARNHLSLQDNRLRKCKDVPEAELILNMSNGYGFCGTMDSRLKALGQAEAVNTIQ